jgi:hypothetical protein
MSERVRIIELLAGAVLMLLMVVLLSSVGGAAYKLGFDDGQKSAKGRGE